MRSIFLLLGLLFSLLHGAPLAHAALTAPASPAVIAPFVQSVIDHIEGYLAGATTRGPVSCDAEKEEYAEAAFIASLLFDPMASLVLPMEDITRSVCFMSDIVTLERYLKELIDLALESARNCDIDAETQYDNAIDYVWKKIAALRRYGLDPRFAAGGVVMVPKAGVGPADDDALCPYYSGYAIPTFNPAAFSSNVGCDLGILPPSVSDRFVEETTFLQLLIERLDRATGLAEELKFFRTALTKIWSDVDQFVRSVSIKSPSPLQPLVTFEPVFAPASVPNAGESGCLDWPSDVTAGPVTGEDIPLKNFFPPVLTRELAETIAYLIDREDETWLEYVRAFDRRVEEGLKESESKGFVGTIITRDDLLRENRRHLRIETFSILTIRDPQSRMENIANALHKRTRALVQHAVALPSGSSTATNLPPLRAFAGFYAQFLSRMCVNRGCFDPLLRTVELSLRDECFSSFLMHTLTSAGTLEPCRALYVD